MEILFGLFILAVLIVGLLYRRRQNKAWIREERYDESGAWVDKRAGERGTYGSLDAEMEAERRHLRRKDQVNELSRLIRNYAIEHYPGFHELNDAQIMDYSNFVKTQAAPFVTMTEQLLLGKKSGAATRTTSDTPHDVAVKKLILDFSYRHFPGLLDLEIETIKEFDRYAGFLAADLLAKIEAFKA